MLKHFEDIAEAVKKLPGMTGMAVAGAADSTVLEACLQAYDEGLADPIFVGDADQIRSLLREMGRDAEKFAVVHSEKQEEGAKAVQLVREGKASVLMKGMTETRDILKPVVNKENGLSAGALMSHVGLFDRVPGTDHFIVQTDGGMLLYPTLEEKKDIIRNAVDALHRLGIERPKVAVLAAVEKVNPKMKETVDAAELVRMNLEGEITGCDVIGPISYDLAMSRSIAQHKKYDCPWCGDFDVLVVPDIVAGNILGKCWTVTAGALLGGIVVGASAPIVLTSRGSSAEEKFYSIALAVLVARGGENV